MSDDDRGAMRLTTLLDKLVENTDGEEVTMGDLLDALQTRSYGPLLLVPAVIGVSPLGAIPGVAVVTGTIILLVAAQILAYRKQPWLPERILRFSFPREKLTQAVDKGRPWVERLEKPFQPRLSFLTRWPLLHFVALVCLLLAVLFYPLALVPFGVAAPGVAVIFLSLGITVRDGAAVLLGFALTAGSIALLVWLWPF